MLELVSNCLAVFWATGVNVETKGKLIYIGAGMAAIGCAVAGIGQGYTGGKQLKVLHGTQKLGTKLAPYSLLGMPLLNQALVYP